MLGDDRDPVITGMAKHSMLSLHISARRQKLAAMLSAEQKACALFSDMSILKESHFCSYLGQMTAATAAATSQELCVSGWALGVSRPGTKYPVRGIPHFDHARESSGIVFYNFSRLFNWSLMAVRPPGQSDILRKRFQNDLGLVSDSLQIDSGPFFNVLVCMFECASR